MTILDAIKERHSVRCYTDKKIPAEILSRLRKEISACNGESGLHIQLVTNEPKAFDSMLAHYGKFSGVENYIAMVGPKSAGLDELCGYYGERLVLLAQTLGLNTCWVALTFSKGAAKKHIAIGGGEKLVIVIALGYGRGQGTAHKSKSMEVLSQVNGEMPGWFKKGMDAAILAPTAVNQQKFHITLCGDKARAESLGGICAKIDLGIVKYHFEVGAGTDSSIWV